MKLHLLSALAYLVFTTSVWAQASGNERYNELNRVAGNSYKTPAMLNDNAPQAVIQSNDFADITISVLYNAKPDHLVAIFNFVQIGENINEMNSLSNERIKGFQDGLFKLGIKPEQIFIDMVSFVPMYEVEVEKKLFSKNYSEVPKGFELQKNIHISFQDENKLNEIVTVASLYEIYDLVKVDYVVNDNAKIYAQMQESAQFLASAKMERYKKMGVVFNNRRLMSENKQVHQPNTRYASYQAYSLHSIEGKKKGSVTVNQMRKPVSLYYNKVSENAFDLVINPLVLNPVVQYAYTLTVRCFIDYSPAKAEPAPTIQVPVKEYWIITPAGDVKPLPK
jgi:hypothetical protein